MLLRSSTSACTRQVYNCLRRAYSTTPSAQQSSQQHPSSSGSSITVCDSVAKMRQFRAGLKGTVGFVPTMGCLHEGHLALARQAKRECDHVLASIFVNPSQFAAHEDFNIYPRQLPEDLRMFASVGVEACFTPSITEMYHNGVGTDAFGAEGTFVEVKGKSAVLEGSIRPHFFIGVATVVNKLFNITQPTVAFFGQKDVQQCVIIRQMVRDLHMPVAVRVCATIREHDGLAMSSRNRYLSPTERLAAPALFNGLSEALNEHYIGRNERRAAKLIEVARSVIEKEPLATVQYLSIADGATLKEVETVGPSGAIFSGAIKVGKTRLIDNILLDFKL